MNLNQTYSHYCGVKPKEAFIDEQYYPVPFDKYVVVQNSSGMKSKNFDNWDLVTPNIKLPIIQLGSKEDVLLPNVFDLRGQTNFNNTAFILKRAALFIGNDSVCNHMASAFNVPRIALFGATLPQTCGGHWNKNTGVEINPFDRYGCAGACHGADCIRPNKCINSIPVKFVLENVANLIGKEHVNICDILHVGPLSRHSVLEWIPYDLNDATVRTLSHVAGLISVRHDIQKQNIGLISNLLNQLNLKYVIISDSTDVEALNVVPNKVEQVLLKITPENTKEFIGVAKSLHNRYYRPVFVSSSDHEAFNEHKLEMINYPPIAKMTDFEYNDTHKPLIGQKLEIGTARRLIGRDGKMYATMHDAKNSKNMLENIQNLNYIDIEEEHLKELQFLILKKYAKN